MDCYCLCLLGSFKYPQLDTIYVLSLQYSNVVTLVVRTRILYSSYRSRVYLSYRQINIGPTFWTFEHLNSLSTSTNISLVQSCACEHIAEYCVGLLPSAHQRADHGNRYQIDLISDVMAFSPNCQVPGGLPDKLEHSRRPALLDSC